MIVILVLAVSIAFGTLKVSQLITTSLRAAQRDIKQTQNEFVQETRALTERLRREIRRDAISLGYAFRRSSMEDRELAAQDLIAGYQFVDGLLGPASARTKE